MNYKKAVGAGLLVFAIQFALANVLGNIVGPFIAKAGTIAGYTWQGVMILLLVTIVYFISKWYFTGNKLNLSNGFILGSVIVITNVTVTLAQAIPAVILGQDVTKAIIDYLTSTPFWFTVLTTVAASTTTVYLMQRKSPVNLKEALGTCMPSDSKECTDCEGGTCEAHKS